MARMAVWWTSGRRIADRAAAADGGDTTQRCSMRRGAPRRLTSAVLRWADAVRAVGGKLCLVHRTSTPLAVAVVTTRAWALAVTIADGACRRCRRHDGNAPRAAASITSLAAVVEPQAKAPRCGERTSRYLDERGGDVAVPTRVGG